MKCHGDRVHEGGFCAANIGTKCILCSAVITEQHFRWAQGIEDEGGRTVKDERVVKCPEVDVVATTPEDVVAELTKRGYDPPAARKYAKAARSWTKKDSVEWNVWLGAEKLLGGG